MKNILVFLVYFSLQHGSAENCQLNISLQNDFDFSKFMGLWYEISSYTMEATSERLLADVEHKCIQTDTGAATVYTQGRTSPTSPCSMTLSNLTTTEEKGKLQFETQYGGAYHLWIVDTDYNDYAMVYGCYNESTSGSCTGSRAWIWSRSKSLSQNALDKTAIFYRNICLPKEHFETITYNQSCSVKTHWKLFEGQDCNVSNIDVQDNFDASKYFSGSWYEIKWLSSIVYPAEKLFQDYQHRYVITSDGNVTGYAYGRSPTDMLCFYGSSIIEMTATPGQQIYRPINKKPSPYWVLRTDYTRYAVVYGCYNISSDGSCYEARSWIWSRTPTLPDQLQFQANRILQRACVNPTAFLPTEQNELCDSKPSWNIDNQNCNFTRVANVVQENFSTDKFSRVWYELSSVSRSSTKATDNRLEVFFNTGGDMTIFSRFREGSSCKYAKETYRKTDHLGMFISQSSTDAFNFWIAGTDYSSYAVVYTCERVGSDGQCESARGSVWSRSPTLPQQHQYTANSILQELCLNPTALAIITHSNECKPQEMKPVCTATSDAPLPYPLVTTYLVPIISCLVYRI